MMDTEHLLRLLILGLAAFVCGIVLYLATVNLIAGLHGYDRAPAFSYAAARLGFVIVLLLIIERIFRAPFIPSEWRSWAFVLGLALALGGYVGVAFFHRRRHIGD